MKVIFLDNDGVICLANNWGGRAKKWKKYKKLNPEATSDTTAPVDVRFDDFDKKAVKVLNQVLEETGAEIVVSSDWRLYATLEEIGETFDLTRERVRQIKEKAIRRLKHTSRSKILKTYLG